MYFRLVGEVLNALIMSVNICLRDILGDIVGPILVLFRPFQVFRGYIKVNAIKLKTRNDFPDNKVSRNFVTWCLKEVFDSHEDE